MAGGTSTQTFDFETMAVVLYALKEAKCTLGSKHYDMMSKASSKSGGSQSSNSFNHKFRAVKQRANDLLEQERAASGSTAAKGTTAAGKRKRAKKDDEDDMEGDADVSPDKKIKAE